MRSLDAIIGFVHWFRLDELRIEAEFIYNLQEVKWRNAQTL